MSSHPNSATSEDLWASFLSQDQSGRYDGLRFEELALALLRARFPGNWEPTKMSHDGSRDFVMRVGDIEHWAECKSYREKISFHIISPTLIMALLQSVGKVIFFSRSDFNENALGIIGRYGARLEKEIVLFAGDSLVDLVFQHPAIAAKYFPGVRQPKRLPRGLASSVSISRDASRAELPSTSRREITGDFDLDIYDLVRLDLSVRNTDIERPVRAVISVGNVSPQLKPLSQSRIELDLAPGRIVTLPFFFKAIEAGSAISLPSISVMELNSPGRVTNHTHNSKIRIRNLFRVNLVGEQFRNVMEEFKRNVVHRNRPVVFTIAGRSGVGKSRLLQEFFEIGISHGYVVQLFESELSFDLSADQLIRQFLANINELPIFAEASTLQYCQDVASHEAFDRTEAEILKTLLKILYNQSFSVLENKDAVIEAMNFSISRKPIMLLIDNVQNREDQFSELLSRFVQQLDDLNAQFVLVLCFNEDLVLAGSEVAALFRRLRSMRYDANQRSFFKEIHEFSRKDAAEFLDLALCGDPNNQGGVAELRRTLDLFLDYVQPRPLHLWQTLMYLTDVGALSLIDDKIFVSDPTELRVELKMVPAQLPDLFAKRWDFVQQKCGKLSLNPQQLERLTRSLYLLGTASPKELRLFGATESEIEFLTQSGFFRIRSTGTVEFFHYQVFLFFRSRCRQFPREEATFFQAILSRYHYATRLYQQFFILSYDADNVTPRKVHAAIKAFLAQGSTRDYGAEFCVRLKSHILGSPSKSLLSSERLIALRRLSEYMHHVESLREGVPVFEEVYSFLMRRWRASARHGLEFIDFVHALANAYLSASRDGRALEALDLALANITSFTFGSERSKKIAMCRLLNRRMAVRKALGLKSQALEDAEVAIGLSRDIGDFDLLMQNYLDCAGIYILEPSEFDLAYNYLESGLQIYRAWLSTNQIRFHPRGAYAEGVLLLMSGDLRAAGEVLGPAARMADHENNPFWAIRLLLLDVCRMLMQKARDEAAKREIRKRLTEVRDIWNISGDVRNGWAICYLEAKWGLAFGEHLVALQALSQALRQMEEHLQSREAIERFKLRLYDVAICFRDLGRPAGNDELGWLPVEVRSELLAIIDMNYDDFRAFKRGVIASSALAAKDSALLILG
jgi:tetratricopeptide (TPR) repeat protein